MNGFFRMMGKRSDGSSLDRQRSATGPARGDAGALARELRERLCCPVNAAIADLLVKLDPFLVTHFFRHVLIYTDHAGE